MYFVHQIKRTNGTIEKGIVVKETLPEAKQAFHAYLGAYAYNHDSTTDYVQAMITDIAGYTPSGCSEIWGYTPTSD